MNHKQNNYRGRQRPHGKRNPSHNNNGGGNRPDVKVAGNAKQQLDKYNSLARDAAQSGDFALSENYLQHADHFQRTLNERQERTPSQNDNRDQSQNDNRKQSRHRNSRNQNDENKKYSKDDNRPSDTNEDKAPKKVAEPPKETKAPIDDKVVEILADVDEKKDEKSKGARKTTPRKPRAKKAEKAGPVEISE